MTSTRPIKPSLIDAHARGGDIAEGGFSFQEAVLLASIPEWLTFDAFTSVLREGVSDIEVRLFSPTYGYRIDAIQAKGFNFTLANLKEELARFRDLDANSPNTFQWFTIASTGLSESLQPLVNGLRRIRGAYGFYDAASGIMEESFDQYAERAISLGLSRDDTRFIFDRVLFSADWTTQEIQGESLFRQRLLQHHPEYQLLPSSVITAAFSGLLKLVKARKAQTITRSEIEEILDTSRTDSAATSRLLRVHTMYNETLEPKGAIRLDWEKFFGGDARKYPPHDEWRTLSTQLTNLRKWIDDNKRPRRLALSGSRRLSSGFALGHAFPAVAGFQLEMEVQGSTWSSANHPDASTQADPLQITMPTSQSERLIVSIGVGRNIQVETRNALQSLGLTDSAVLNFYLPGAVTDAKHANAIVRHVKDAIVQALLISKSSLIDLFFAGPSPLASFLGHRLNATAVVQCYEWTSGSDYVPTCTLGTVATGTKTTEPNR